MGILSHFPNLDVSTFKNTCNSYHIAYKTPLNCAEQVDTSRVVISPQFILILEFGRWSAKREWVLTVKLGNITFYVVEYYNSITILFK